MNRTLDYFPPEVLCIIFSKLTHTRFAVAQTCWVFCNVIHNIVGYVKINVTSARDLRRITRSFAKSTVVDFVKHHNVTDRELSWLKGWHTVDLSYCYNITGEGVDGLLNIHTVDLCYCRQLTDKGIRSFAGVHAINIEGCTYISDIGIAALSGVHTINICATSVTDIGLKQLIGLHTVYVSHIVRKEVVNDIENAGGNVYNVSATHKDLSKYYYSKPKYYYSSRKMARNVNSFKFCSVVTHNTFL